MPEALRLLPLPVWLGIAILIVILVANFIDGVVKLDSNWPKFCQITRSTIRNVNYWGFVFWLNKIDDLCFKVWAFFLRISGRPSDEPEGDGPAGAPSSATLGRDSGRKITASTATGIVLRVIEGGKDKVVDFITILFTPVVRGFATIAAGAVAISSASDVAFSTASASPAAGQAGHVLLPALFAGDGTVTGSFAVARRARVGLLIDLDRLIRAQAAAVMAVASGFNVDKVAAVVRRFAGTITNKVILSPVVPAPGRRRSSSAWVLA